MALPPTLNFAGFSQADIGLVEPPDTVGDVGKNHYIQAVNGLLGVGSLFNIHNKSDGSIAVANQRMGAFAETSLCSVGAGDPIVLYDEAADRWLLSEFAGLAATPPVAMCVYISQTSDPTDNLWHAYEFQTQNFPDYPHYGVTNDAFVVTTNENDGGLTNPAVYALDRQNMLAGLPARPFQRFQAPALNGWAFQALTPADADGTTPPPAGSPAYVLRQVDDEFHGSSGTDPQRDFLEIWEFVTDFDTPANSSFQRAQSLGVADFDSDLCAGALNCILQPGTAIGLDAIPQVIMNRLQYRNFGTHETLVGNFSVDVNGFDRAGVHWFELRKDPSIPNDNWRLHQEGTISPDGDSRWMAAVAMDGTGNIAAAYNVSSSVTSPGIRYTGRRPADPLGVMTLGENVAVHGQGYFNAVGNRWGDYSAMSVDPVDDSTFWFTGEYAMNGEWATQILAFKIDPAPDPTPDPGPPSVIVSGMKFNDLNGNGRFDMATNVVGSEDEPGIENIGFYLDLDEDGRPDLGEPAVRSDEFGKFEIALDRGDREYILREEQQPGWMQTLPNTSACPLRDPGPACGYTITVVNGVPSQQTGLDFGNMRLVDYGDAPDSYKTLKASDGAFHPILPGLHMGASVDDEMDGIPGPLANGDDLNRTNNDEDGVQFTEVFFPGAVDRKVEVTVMSDGFSPGRLNAWFDFNGDGDFADAGEHAIVDEIRATGTTMEEVDVPSGAKEGLTYARFRYGYRRFSLGEEPSGGDLSGGEVEDYQVRILGETPTAENDTFTVDQDTTANPLDLLANDTPSRHLPLEIVSVTTPNRGGQAILVGNSVRYTPAAGFVGAEQFSYTVRDQANNTATALVTISVTATSSNPIAVDDSFNGNDTDPFRVLENSTDNPLPVLANDLPGPNSPTGIVAFSTPASGFVTIDDRGNSDAWDDQFLYTPPAGFSGTDTFTYTIEDSQGNQSTARVTIHIQPGAMSDDVVEYRMVVSDLNGSPIDAITIGEQFLLRVYVRDLRTADPDPNTPGDQRGVFAGFLDVLYDTGRVSISEIARGPNFSVFPQGTVQAGVIDEVGGTQGVSPVTGPAEQLLLSITATAFGTGLARFIGDPADETTANGGGLHDTLTIIPASAVPVAQMRFIDDTVSIVSAGDLPKVVDDTFNVAARASVVIPATTLDVLGNDTTDLPPLTITTVGTASNGQTAIGPNGTNVTYLPNVGFNGSDQFTYTATASNGLPATATVTVQVGSSTKLVDFTLEARRLDGSLINGGTIAPGDRFQVMGYIQDRRAASQPDRGLFGAYMDLLYDSALVSTVPDSQNPLGFMVQFGSDYGNFPAGNVSTPNVIDELGSIQVPGSTGNFLPLGGDRKMLFNVTLDAVAAGMADFWTNPADILPLHDTLFFEPSSAVSYMDIGFGGTSVQIVGGGEGEQTNSKNHLDVNADTFVSPIDALLVINRLNKEASGSSAEGESLKHYYDVDGNTRVTPRDALMVINHLNELVKSQASGEGEGSALSRSLVASSSAEQSSSNLLDSDSPGRSLAPVNLIPRGSSAAAGRNTPVRSTPDSESGVDNRVYQRSGNRDQLFARWRDEQSNESEQDEHALGSDGGLLSEILDELTRRGL